MYRFLDHPADVLVEAEGDTLGEAMSSCAVALFETIADISRMVEPAVSREVRVSGVADLQELVHAFLSELLYVFDVDALVFSRFDLEVDTDILELTCICHGDRFDPLKYPPGTEVKAVTYHDMVVRESAGRWYIRVLFDI